MSSGFRLHRIPHPYLPSLLQIGVVRQNLKARWVVVLAAVLSWGCVAAQTAATVDYQDVLSAVANAPAVRLAQSRYELARLRSGVAASPVTGTLSGGYAQTWGERSASTLPTPESLDGGDLDPITLRANVNVVPFGPRFDQAQQAAAAAEQAARDVVEARAQAVVDGTQRYLDALRAQQDVVLRESSVDAAVTVLEARRTQRLAGAVTASAVAQAEADLDRARAEAEGAHRALARALQVLSLSLNTSPSAVVGEPPAARQQPALTEDDIERLLRERGDVTDAREALVQAQRSAAAAIRDQLPSAVVALRYQNMSPEWTWSTGVGFDTRVWQPDAFVSIDPDSGLPATLADGRQTSVVLSASLSVPLDVTLADALAAADMSVEVAKQQFEQIVALARLDLVAVRDQLAGATATATSAQVAARFAASSAAEIRERLRLGLVSELDVTAAELTAARAAFDAARAGDAALLARMRMAIALGLDPQEVF